MVASKRRQEREEEKKPKRTETPYLIPQEVITTEILSRLPGKSLFRFKSVCKSWYTLLNDPFFLKTYYLHRSKQGNTLSFMIHDEHSLFKLDYDTSSSSLNKAQEIAITNPLKSSDSEFNILASCDGIYLIHVCNINTNVLYLWNPSTSQKKVLPEKLSKLLKHGDRRLYKSGYGIGYDSSADDYKVVRMCSCCAKSDVRVYSMQTNSCKRIQSFPRFILSSLCITRPWNIVSGISHDGAIHWLGECVPSAHKFSLKIVSFGIAGDEYKDAQVPEFNITSSMELGVLDECICIYASMGSYVDVYVMKEYGVRESWTKRFTIQQPGYGIPDPTFDAVCTTGNGKILAQWNKRDLVLYDTTEGGSEGQKIKIDGVSTRFLEFFHIERYIHSLVPLTRAAKITRNPTLQRHPEP